MATLNLMKKTIDLTKSTLLFEDDFAQGLQNWNIASGNWTCENSTLIGNNLDNSGGMIYAKPEFHTNVLLDFTGKMLPPCNNDLNFTWNTEGWLTEKNDAGIGYIAGLNGWWEQKTGIEHYPECTVRSVTTGQNFAANQTYHVQAGSIDGHCFIFVDGKLVLEMFDPFPIDYTLYGKIGFGTYCSHIAINHVKVYEIFHSFRPQSYAK